MTEGFEAALNIDRESFNFSHPHAVFITKWLHSALRRSATVQKRLAAEVRFDRRERLAEEADERLATIVRNTWQTETDDPASEPPDVVFVDSATEPATTGDAYRFDRTTVFGEAARQKAPTAQSSKRVERQLKAIIQVLAAHRFLDELTVEQRDRLVTRIREILDED